MVDISELSNEELMALQSGQQGNRPQGIKTLSNDELLAMQQDPAKSPDAFDEKMHGDITWEDRLAVKNLSSSIEGSVGYLRNQHPELEIKANGAGRILIKRPNEKRFKVLDPSGFDVQDLSDVGFDILAGIGEGAAVIAGGLAGNIPGAIAAGAGAGLATEGLRQSLGAGIGIEDNLNVGNLALSTGLGAVSPLLFGSGVGIKQAANVAIKQSTTGAAKVAANRGLLSQLAERPLAFAGRKAAGFTESFTNIPKESIQTLAKNFDEVVKSNPQKMLALVQDTHFKLKDNLNRIIFDVGEKIENTIADHGFGIDMKGALKTIDDKIAKLEKIPRKTESNKNKLAAMINFKNTHLIDAATGKPIKIMDSSRAFELKKTMSELSKFGSTPGRIDANVIKGSDIAADETRIAREIGGAISDEITSVVNKIDTKTGTSVLSNLKREWGDLQGIQTDLIPKFSTTQKASATLRNLGSEANITTMGTLQNLQDKYGVNVFDNANLLSAMSRFGDQANLAISGIGRTTSTSKSVPLASFGAGIGGSLGFAAGGPIGGILGGGIGGAAATKLGGAGAVRKAVRVIDASGKVLRHKTSVFGRQIGAEVLQDQENN